MDTRAINCTLFAGEAQVLCYSNDRCDVGGDQEPIYTGISPQMCCMMENGVSFQIYFIDACYICLS